ncbi:MAG: hypothetical protein P4L84_22705 [Isosphaeraceae bacterium]|nr:hypothetical protein [Isosphaeraceae bacterium]
MLLSKTATRRSILFAGLAAIVVGGEVLYTRRKERYLRLARHHRHRAAPLDGQSGPEAALRCHHLKRARQYERAACRPWVRVTP